MSVEIERRFLLKNDDWRAEAGQPTSTDGKSLEPKMAHGLQSMSIGYLVAEDTPMIWRGPMVTQTLEQLLRDTRWHDLDYLIIDLPPGTGDTQLTLSQKVPVSGAIIVTTPQDIALLDARRAVSMFRQVKVPILGIVENMSGYVCPHCGKEVDVFSRGGGEELAREMDVAFLGRIPLDPRVVVAGDEGHSFVERHPDSPATKAFAEVVAAVRDGGK